MENKIIIHYIWFENYYCFHNQGINLSSKYIFKFNPDDEKVCMKDNSSNFIDDFFYKNIDVTAIVGENGTGKTSFLRFILSLCRGDLIQYPCVIVCEQDAKYWAGRYYSENNQIIYKKIGIKRVDTIEPQVEPYNRQRFPLGRDVRFIYLSEMFSSTLFNTSFEGADNLSFASILYNLSMNGDADLSTKNPVAKYIHKINDWQLNFIANGEDFVQQFKIKFPPYIHIRFNYDAEAFTKWYIRLNTDKKNVSDEKSLRIDANILIKAFLKNNNYTNMRNQLATAIFMNIITSFDFVLNMKKDEGQVFIEMIKEISASSRNAWENVYDLLVQINSNNEKYNNILNNRMPKSDKKVTYISVNANPYIEYMDYFSKFVNYTDKYIYKNYYENVIWISTNEIETIKEFFNNYKQCVETVDFLSFSWGLSSGENLLLNQFGKLIHILKKDLNGKYYLPSDVNSNIHAKNAIIMLDEAEVAFHPEWQRIYFDAFLNFINENIANQGTHVQIIIATHSPIILSDIPKQNTVFLKKFEEEDKKGTESVDNPETFAANIFSLYQNAFFLNEAGIGYFAERKLCDLIDEIHQLYGDDKTSALPTQKQKEEIIKKIKCIGDPYIRHKFEMEYQYEVEKAEGAKIALEKRINNMEAQLIELKQQRNKLGE